MVISVGLSKAVAPRLTVNAAAETKFVCPRPGEPEVFSFFGRRGRWLTAGARRTTGVSNRNLARASKLLDKVAEGEGILEVTLLGSPQIAFELLETAKTTFEAIPPRLN